MTDDSLLSERVRLIKNCIRDVPDFPKPGILFKDIAPLLEDEIALQFTVQLMAERWGDQKIDRIAGLESRGFPFGAALAYELNRGFVMMRKPGKLPSETIAEEYALEYGTDRIEMHVDAIQPGQRVLIVDDLLATGGTAAAATRLVKKAGGVVVGCAFVVELAFLNGAEKLDGVPYCSILKY